MTKKVNYAECMTKCPYRNDPDFDAFMVECRGYGERIRLDEWAPVVDGDTRVGELAVLACGSKLSPDADKPTISLQDWADTPLDPSQLRELHDQGNLPDQIIDY